MPTLITREIPIQLSSDPADGATNISSDGSSFFVTLEEPIVVPQDAITCTIKSDTQTVWWTVANIHTGVNDLLYIKTVGNIERTITIPEGLYSYVTLGDTINQQMVNAGENNNAFQLLADYSTQKIICKFAVVSATGTGDAYIRFTSQSPYTLLGFLQLQYNLQQNHYYIYAPNEAAFQPLEYFNIHTDLVAQGIRTNSTYDNVVCPVYIPAGTSPGEQIVSQPRNPTRVDASNLIGTSRKRIKVWITDQANGTIELTDIFSVSLIIEYTTLQ